jgi:TIR domain
MLHVFISYSRQDSEELRWVLASVQNIVDAHDAYFDYDDKIHGGTFFPDALYEKIRKADLYLPLLTRSFIASEWCRVKELHFAYQRHREGHCVIMPIVLRPCDWKNIALERPDGMHASGAIKRLGELHTYMNPVHRLDTLSSADQFYHEVLVAIRRMLNDIRQQREGDAPRAHGASRTTEQSRSMFLDLGRDTRRWLGSDAASWCDFAPLSSSDKTIWFGRHALPLLRTTDRSVRSNHPMLRVTQEQMIRLLMELRINNKGGFRLPTVAEWKCAMTANGTATIIPHRLPASMIAPRWGDQIANEAGIYMPCLGADEWVSQGHNQPGTLAALYRGLQGPDPRLRHWTGPCPGIQPSVRLVCDDPQPPPSV